MITSLSKEKKYWEMPPTKLLSEWHTSDAGLSQTEAHMRLSQYGVNDIEERRQRHGLTIFIEQLTSPLVLVLIAAAIVAYILGETVDAIVIIAIVMMSAVLGFIQEYKAEVALRTLKKLITRKAKVLRDGQIVEIEVKEVVPGDIVILDIGDVIPADIRLLSAEDLSVNESSLTGESLPVSKNCKEVKRNSPLPSDLTNMVFKGSTIQTGHGKGIAVLTGKDTFFGKTAKYLSEEDTGGEFQQGINKFSNFLLKVILVLTVFNFAANALLGKGIFESLLFAVALAVGITPEILPIIMTISLSNGALRMAKKKVIVKRLSSVEDLGNIDTLCSDKTGTLTKGDLVFEKYLNVERETDDYILVKALLCNTLQGKETSLVSYNQMDHSIFDFAKKLPAKKVADDYTIVDENEFDFNRRVMSVVAEKKGQHWLIAKGSPDSLLADCHFVKKHSQIIKLTAAEITSIKNEIELYENQGYRVLGVAEKTINKTDSTKKDEKGLTFLGFLLFSDVIKETAPEAVRNLQRLAVTIKILSGDSPIITQKVCKEVGIKIIEDKVICGQDLLGLDEKALEQISWQYNVFARLTPEQKYQIVKSLNREGHIVGFLGDGINDAPALRAADVGIAVDSGAEIAKEAADVILLNKSLYTISKGIIEGRKIFANISKYIMNTISANFGNMFTVAISSFFLTFIPLLPSQILLNNFMSDFPLLTISTDHVDLATLRRPRRWNIKMISRFMIFFGFISTFFDLSLIVPLVIFKVDPTVFRTAWFIESSLSEIVVTFAIRTHFFFLKSRPSKLLTISSILTIIGVIGITYMPIGAKLFSFVPLSPQIIGFVAAVLLAYFLVTEGLKHYFFGKYGE